MTINEAERKLDEFAKMLDILKAYAEKKLEYVDLKKNLSKNGKKYL